SPAVIAPYCSPGESRNPFVRLEAADRWIPASACFAGLDCGDFPLAQCASVAKLHLCFTLGRLPATSFRDFGTAGTCRRPRTALKRRSPKPPHRGGFRVFHSWVTRSSPRLKRPPNRGGPEMSRSKL